MSLTITNHPLQPLAERIEAARIRRDAEAFARLLSGDGVPNLSREGDDPAEVIWYCISRYMQPVDPDWFDPLADVLQQQVEQLANVLAGEVHAVAQVNGPSFSSTAWGAFAKTPLENWEQYEPYIYNLLLFSSLFPARKGLFGALEHLRIEGLSLPAILNSRAIPMLRTSLMAQQTDDRLVTKWMDQFIQACKQLNNRVERTHALTLWRALLLAPASGEQEFDVDRVQSALQTALGNEQEAEDSRMMFVQIALQQMEQLWGGTPRYWRSVFAPGSEWPDTIKKIAQDLWPDPQDADTYLSADHLAFWRQLDLSTRQRIRQAFRSDAVEWNRTFFDLFNDTVPDRQKLQGLHQYLQAANPMLSHRRNEITCETGEETKSTESGEEQLQRQWKNSNHAQYERVTKQIADIERLLRKGAFDKAFDRYQQLLQRQESSGTAGKHLAMTAANVAKLFLASGNKGTAEKIYLEAVRRFSNDVVMRSGLADVLKAQERYAEAETLYRETVKLFPNAVVPRCGLAEVLKAQERYAETEALYLETVKLFPRDVVPRCGLADVIKAQERYAEAETLYRETVKLFPNAVVPRCGLAEVLKAQERYAETETLYRETVGLFPNDVVPRNGLAEVLKAQERYAEAETLYRETVKFFPNAVVSRNGLADVLKVQEHYAEAENLYRETVVLFPSDVVSRCGLADVIKVQERYAEAENLYRETVKLFPNAVVPRNGLADVLKVQEHYAEAENFYRETVVLFPSDVVSRCGLADVIKVQERYAEAENLYRETVVLFPSDVVSRCGLADVIKAQERYAEAETLYREIMRLFPNSMVARNGLANVLRKLNQLDEAETLLSGRLSSNPEGQRFDEAVLALIEVKRGLFDKAVRRITDAASVCARQTSKARLLALAASIELRQNKPREAFALMKDESIKSNDEAVRLLAWHVTLATTADETAAVASRATLKLISERARKIEKSIFDLVNSGQSLCGNDYLFEQECDLLAA